MSSAAIKDSVRDVGVEDRTCDHSDFAYCTQGASPYTFVFQRSVWIIPTSEQLRVYRSNALIVNAHGGRMILQEHEIAGMTPTFTEDDVRAATDAVLKANPDLELDQSWNGVGSRSLSVGCKKRSMK